MFNLLFGYYLNLTIFYDNSCDLFLSSDPKMSKAILVLSYVMCPSFELLVDFVIIIII